MSRIAVVTDSSAMLPDDLAVRLGVIVVPLTIVVGERRYREGVDLDADGFCALVDAGAGPATTTQPSPGEILAVYEQAVRDGATGICSVHVGSSLSGTVGAATLAASLLAERHPDVVVRVVDSGVASFGVGLATWAAADVLADGGGLDQAARAAEASGAATVTAFSLGALHAARRSGRFAQEVLEAAAAVVDIPVLAGPTTDLAVVGSAADEHGLIDLLVAPLADVPGPLRVGICRAHPATGAIADTLHDRVSALPTVAEIVRYRVGPSVAAHTGVDTAGWVAAPITLPDVRR